MSDSRWETNNAAPALHFNLVVLSVALYRWDVSDVQTTSDSLCLLSNHVNIIFISVYMFIFFTAFISHSIAAVWRVILKLRQPTTQKLEDDRQGCIRVRESTLMNP
jgi:hypothetical protein